MAHVETITVRTGLALALLTDLLNVTVEALEMAPEWNKLETDALRARARQIMRTAKKNLVIECN